MTRVFIASPLAPRDGRIMADNLDYARAAMRDSLKRGESPLAPHLLYPQLLDDADPDERALGMKCGLEWLNACELLAIYADHGVSSGMAAEIKHAELYGIPREQRVLVWG